MYWIVTTYHAATEIVSEWAVSSDDEIRTLENNGVIVSKLYGPFRTWDRANDYRSEAT